jgi:branched-chain amino acid aminotransferase
MRVWCDGSVLEDPYAPAVRVDDHGLTVGDGVFETLKVADGVPFALTRHLRRLSEGAARLGLPEPDLDAVRRGIAAVVPEDEPLARLRITYTSGPGPFGSGRGVQTPSLIVALSPMDPMQVSSAVARVPWVRNERSAVAGIKTISFAENVVALARARELGAGEAIFANTLGHVCEGTGSNLGYVIDGQARTPSLASGCLPGVTRALLLEWADVVEADEPLGVLDDASELFLLSSTREVHPVHRIEDRELPAPGPVTAALMATWAARSADETDP